MRRYDKLFLGIIKRQFDIIPMETTMENLKISFENSLDAFFYNVLVFSEYIPYVFA
jgi:hypothetical protein